MADRKIGTIVVKKYLENGIFQPFDEWKGR
jgi:hypothetical protein